MFEGSRLKAFVAAAAIALALPVAGSATTPREDDAPGDAPQVATAYSHPGAPAALQSPLAPCSSGAHSLSHFGERVYPEDGQRRLHERPHGRTPGLRRRHEPLPAREPRRPDGSSHAVPDRLQPRLRAHERERRRPEHDRRLGPRERTARVLHVRPADLSRAIRTGRTTPTRSRTRSPTRTPSARRTRTRPPARPRSGNNSQNGTQCPANKLVITPSAPIADGRDVHACTVNYTGRPGVHVDGDGSTEGWFRVEHGRGAERRQLRHHRAGRHRRRGCR